MTPILRAAAIGLIAAIAVAMIPLLFKLALGIAVVLFVGRMIYRSSNRYWQEGSGMWRRPYEHPKYDSMPINGQWSRPARDYEDRNDSIHVL